MARFMVVLRWARDGLLMLGRWLEQGGRAKLHARLRVVCGVSSPLPSLRACIVANISGLGWSQWNRMDLGDGLANGAPAMVVGAWRDTASRGPTTIVAPESQFRTCPSDHGKASSNIAHDPIGITDSACKNQLVVVSVQYGPFNPYIPIRSTTNGKSRVAIDPIAMHTSWRSNSDITSELIAVKELPPIVQYYFEEASEAPESFDALVMIEHQVPSPTEIHSGILPLNLNLSLICTIQA
ncbi:protein MADS AFFECTING FLOWERING 5 [Dorcoceras hygrometricum]|uniref:Protein MADS AFFECTING FLOWERING 5 n=1 Tax=Dorcoceras hygrometricum TaxID=472368 RepID=A0A2Z7AJR8_9LAMI|nr:protein MADS AFFECTING FLOWERING 5 [Dorcoceras hygrometricum]